MRIAGDATGRQRLIKNDSREGEYMANLGRQANSGLEIEKQRFGRLEELKNLEIWRYKYWTLLKFSSNGFKKMAEQILNCAMKGNKVTRIVDELEL